MESPVGKLTGKGAVHDKHGNLKGEFTISTDLTAEQAARLKLTEGSDDDSVTPRRECTTGSS
jgi:hypothetical protein